MRPLKSKKIFLFSKLKETTREADILHGYVYLELGEQEQLQVRVHHCLEKTVKEREGGGEGGGKKREVVGGGGERGDGKVGKRERWRLEWGERESGRGGGWKSGEEREVGVRMGRKRVGVVVEEREVGVRMGRKRVGVVVEKWGRERGGG